MLISKFLVRIVGLVTDIIVGLLGLRIILKLLGASTVAPFVGWMYETTKPLLSPFQGMFPSPDIAPRLTIEFSALFAIIAYSFIGYIISDTLKVMDSRNEEGRKK